MTDLKKLNELKSDFNENFKMVIATNINNSGLKWIGILNDSDGSLIIFCDGYKSEYNEAEVKLYLTLESMPSL